MACNGADGEDANCSNGFCLAPDTVKDDRGEAVLFAWADVREVLRVCNVNKGTGVEFRGGALAEFVNFALGI